MSLSSGRKIRKFAIYSRVLVVTLQALFNFLIPDHDAGVFNPSIPQRQRKLLDYIFEVLFGGLRRWDGVYFIHIANYGYTYENTLAFFPSFPMATRVIADTVFYPLSYITSQINILTFSACILNFVLFVESAKSVYELSRCVVKDDRIAFKAALLFCMNPASIFFSAAYSETMFAFFTLKGLLALYKKQQIKSALYIAMSGLTRSNGLINVAFILYTNFKECVHHVINYYRFRQLHQHSTAASLVKLCLRTLVITVLQCLISILPFVLYQYYAFTLYCAKDADAVATPSHIIHYGNQQGYKMPHTGPSPWCHDNIPLAYSYIQNTHWHVGFLSYYELRQIPNFLLAMPMILLCTSAVSYYVKARPFYCATLGLFNMNRDMTKKSDDQQQSSIAKESGYHGDDVYVYIVHLFFLTTFAVTMMHVQVITRFIACSSPVIYWFIATLTTPLHNADQCKPRTAKMDVKIDTNESCIYVYHKSDDKKDNAYMEASNATEEENSSRLNCSQMKRSGAIRSEYDEDSISKDLDELYDWESKTWTQKAIFLYFHLYFFVGCAAFPNFLPWT